MHNVAGGVPTFGSAPAPIAIYQGPTGRKDIKEETVATDAAVRDGDDRHPGHIDAEREGNSIGNVSRGDWI